jgi:hypothetical protein
MKQCYEASQLCSWISPFFLTTSWTVGQNQKCPLMLNCCFCNYRILSTYCCFHSQSYWSTRSSGYWRVDSDTRSLGTETKLIGTLTFFILLLNFPNRYWDSETCDILFVCKQQSIFEQIFPPKQTIINNFQGMLSLWSTPLEKLCLISNCLHWCRLLCYQILLFHK